MKDFIYFNIVGLQTRIQQQVAGVFGNEVGEFTHCHMSSV